MMVRSWFRRRSLVIVLMVVGASALTTAQQAAPAKKAPAAVAPKKNPLLKLIEPWPEPAKIRNAVWRRSRIRCSRPPSRSRSR